jgi:hypothetical protein
MELKPTKAAFECFYDDGSGVEYALRYCMTSKGREIEIESGISAFIPVTHIDWLIENLSWIRDNCVLEFPEDGEVE